MGRKISWFYEHREGLERDGFPVKDEILNGWDSHAIKHWLDDRGGIVKDRPDNELIRELGEWPG